jgi:hypothetical protein
MMAIQIGEDTALNLDWNMARKTRHTMSKFLAQVEILRYAVSQTRLAQR